ncbi:phenylacetate--CoA ligase family protein [Micromonospora sp. NPDC005299]|uniref:phenylacetate--CoA ligase family protein n=1 Tax=Micromonospora sp. NPDC005299 TaxID=3364231 RepID=UPI003674785A
MTAEASLADLTLPDLLFRPPAEVGALQDRLLAETVERCYRGHPFYRRLMKQEGLEPRHIRSRADLSRLPVTRKSDFLADPEAFRLRADDATLLEKTLWKVIYTTGTTSGQPAPVYVTSYDHYAYMYLASRRQDLIGIQTTDVVANLFPLTEFPMGAYSRATDEAAACGAGIVFAHPGRPGSPFPLHRGLSEAVQLVERQRVTVLWGIASFVRRVLVHAREVGADFTAVRMAMITGEAASGAMREDLRRRLQELGCVDPRVVNRYGSTEQGASMVECQEGSGFHSLAPDQVFHEVVDADTGQRLADGKLGMLAFSHLIRRGTVFLRYLVGDVVSMTHETCPHCGRSCPRLTSQPVRSGDFVKVKGTLVNLQVLRDQLEHEESIQEYQIVLRPVDEHDELSVDELVIRLAVTPGTEQGVASAVTAAAVRTTHVRPRVEFVEPSEIFNPAQSIKPVRVLDLRPTRV